ncbi:hypothetical protein EUGRSUZ_A00450 [Eucalyptus grandis]|uniref:Uncharacterized protein n=2 Tax=Eucalyptus grandis TaxID=71139 RepID=A0ACC3M094_EUCGR|nr:hypothetical protein EUGRSUZ_A00450 [Eucalyptus grandis]
MSSFLYGLPQSAERLKGLTCPEDNGNTTFESPPPFPHKNLLDAPRRRLFDHIGEMSSPENGLYPLSKKHHVYQPEDDHVMEDLPSKFADDRTNSANLQNIDISFPTSPWYRGFV